MWFKMREDEKKINKNERRQRFLLNLWNFLKEIAQFNNNNKILIILYNSKYNLIYYYFQKKKNNIIVNYRCYDILKCNKNA